MEDDFTLDCAVCGNKLEWNGCPGGDNNPCATVFQAFGNYGSTVFDPMDGTYLEINICDDCLKNIKAKNRVLIGTRTKVVEKKVDFWA